jgi:hypothetical protein
MGGFVTARRYYLGAARTQGVYGEADLAGEVLGLRAGLPLSPLPESLGAALLAKLRAARAPELEEVGITAVVYEGLEDLTGATADELQTVAGLSPQEAAAVVAALE